MALRCGLFLQQLLEGPQTKQYHTATAGCLLQEVWTALAYIVTACYHLDNAVCKFLLLFCEASD